MGQMAAATAERLGRKVAVVGVGGLSGTIFRHEIDIRNDAIAAPEDDRWNRRMLSLIEKSDMDGVRGACADYAAEARVDMGFKHFAWVLGALGGRFYGARIHAYGPTYGSGAAVIEFKA